MDVKRSSPFPSGDPRETGSLPSQRGEDGIRAREASEQASANQGANELQEAATDRAEHSRRVAREVSRAVREELLGSSDRIDLSSTGEAFAQALEAQESSPERTEHLAGLRAAIEAGSLHTPERLEQAARRMLGDFS